MECLIRTIERRGYEPAQSRRAFTLVESLVASVILALAVLGVCGQLAAGYQQNLVLNQTATAVALGRELMDEIASKPLADPSSGSTTPAAAALGTPRSTFTCVGNYNFYTDSGSSLTTLGGGTLNATSGESFTRSVTVTLGAKPSIDSLSPTTDFALVTVKVTMPSGQTISLQRIKTNYTVAR